MGPHRGARAILSNPREVHKWAKQILWGQENQGSRCPLERSQGLVVGIDQQRAYYFCIWELVTHVCSCENSLTYYIAQVPFSVCMLYFITKFTKQSFEKMKSSFFLSFAIENWLLPFIYSFICSFIAQIFIEHLLNARHHLDAWVTPVNKTGILLSTTKESSMFREGGGSSLVEQEEKFWLKLLLMFSVFMRQMGTTNFLPTFQGIFMYFTTYQKKRKTSPLGSHKEHTLIV